jgi:hypothetical protein
MFLKRVSWKRKAMCKKYTFIASRIAPKFGVSAEVIEKRLRKENVMSLIGK